MVRQGIPAGNQSLFEGLQSYIFTARVRVALMSLINFGVKKIKGGWRQKHFFSSSKYVTLKCD